MRFLTPIGLLLFTFGLYLAFFVHSSAWYGIFLIGGFFVFEGLNFQKGFSVLKNKKWFLLTWFMFILAGIIFEVIGHFWLHLWIYPTFNKLEYFIHVLIIGFPFTGFLGLEFYAFLQRFLTTTKKRVIFLPFFTILFGYLCEYPNTFAYEWRYTNLPLGNLLGITVLMSISWLFLLTVLLFRRPFGFRKI